MPEVKAVRLEIALRPQVSWRSNVWAFIRRKPLGALGGLSLVVIVLTAIAADVIETHDPIVQDIPHRLTAPGADYWFGSDPFGRDVYSRIIHGARISLYVGLVAVIIGAVSGTIVGISSAYFGGRYDLIIQRSVDALLAFPSLVLALALVSALGASINNVTIAISIAFAPPIARMSRASALSVKEEVYVEAARAVGASPLRVMARHVLPNSLTPVIVLSTAYLGSAIVTEAGLSFLGLGVPPPHPSWGRMLQEAARLYQDSALWLTIFPGTALTLTVFGFNLFGDALRDTLDPRLRGR